MENSLSLKWNEFQSCAANSFKQLRKLNEFHDVTLVCDDYKQMSAHKLILSSCSTYFKTVLSQTNHPNPMICLDGISSQELNNILDYIYNGEVLIGQDDIDQFLKIAAKLKLEGLSIKASIKNYGALVTDNEKPSFSNEYECIEEEDVKDHETKRIILPSKIKKTLTVDLKKRKNIITSSQKFYSASDASEEKYKKFGDLFIDNEMEDKPPISNENECIATEDVEDQETRQVHPYEKRGKKISIVPLKEEHNTSVSNESECIVKENEEDLEGKYILPNLKRKKMVVSSQKFYNLKDINEGISKYMSSVTLDIGCRGYVCGVCAKILNNKSHLLDHVEVHFDGIELTCEYCGKVFGGRASLRNHACRMK